MLAKLADQLPAGDYLYEPKWDGFRAVVFRGDQDVYIQSRDSRPLDRYFPELHDALLERLPANCVLDGEIVIATAGGLDFDALQLRLTPRNRASPSSPARHLRRSSRSMCCSGKRTCGPPPRRSGAKPWRSCSRRPLLRCT